ncbi:MAG: chemotaxis protein CheW [Sphingopyxis sp.]|nr:chemotaxis protein CheW [Sphingopyxis sp.]
MATLFLIARIAGRAVAIDSDLVESVVDIGEIIPVPKAGREVRGLAALRSRVVTVIDTCSALGLPQIDQPTARAVITMVDGHHYAVLVDTLEDVAPFTLQPFTLGIALEGGWARVACGFVERDGDAVLAIDPRLLIPGTALAA